MFDSEIVYSQIVDTATSGTTYVGYCRAGNVGNTGTACWAIKKIVVSGTTTTISWSGLSKSMTDIWNNRASLTYA